jgi:hypothetical protein
MPAFRLAPNERFVRAGVLVLVALSVGWNSLGHSGLPRLPVPVLSGALAAGLLSGAVLAMRSCLIITDEGVTDRRPLSVVRVPWPQVTGFRVAPSGALGGGYCIVVDRPDDRPVELLATRAGGRMALRNDLGDLDRLCWKLGELQRERPGKRPGDKPGIAAPHD